MVASHACTGNGTLGPLQLLLITELSLHPLKASFRVVILPFWSIALRAQRSNTLYLYLVIFHLTQTYIFQIGEVGCIAAQLVAFYTERLISLNSIYQFLNYRLHKGVGVR